MLTPAALLSPPQWAEETFGAVDLGDPRRQRRLLSIATAMAEDPAASFPKQLHDPAATQAAYRFFQSPSVTYEELLAPHVQQSRQQAGEHAEVLLLEDTTELDFQQHPQTTGLGPIGNGSRHGLLLQSVLAVLPQDRHVLGLMHQEPFLRQPAPKKETKHERLKRERESQVWERSVQGIGSPPQGVRWVHVGDRSSDIFSFLRLCRQLGCDFTIRAAQDRNVDLPTGCATRLKGENVAPYSPGLASTHSIERRPLSTAQGCKDVTGSIIQRAKCHNARIHVAADRNTNMLELNRQPFFRRSISPQKQL